MPLESESKLPPFPVSVSVVENSPTNIFHLFYRALKSLDYPVEFQENDHQPNSLRVMTDSLDNFSIISILTGRSHLYDIGLMLHDIGCGRYEELGAVLINSKDVAISYKPYATHKLLPPEMRPLLERCFMMAYQEAEKRNGNVQQQCQEKYQQLTKEAVTPLDPETIGDMWCSVILDIQAKEPDLLP